jgi:hypothetical protein
LLPADVDMKALAGVPQGEPGAGEGPLTLLGLESWRAGGKAQRGGNVRGLFPGGKTSLARTPLAGQSASKEWTLGAGQNAPRHIEGRSL